MKPESRTGSRLLALPPEIRDHIYSLAVVEVKPIELLNVRPFLTEPGLLATSRQIRAEATPIFYGENVFQLVNSYSAEHFIDVFNKTKLPLIRSIRAFQERQALAHHPETWLENVKKREHALLKHQLIHPSAVLVPLPVGEKREIVWTFFDKLDDFIVAKKDGKRFSERKQIGQGASAAESSYQSAA